MNLKKLKGFIKSAEQSGNPLLSSMARVTGNNMNGLPPANDDEFSVPELENPDQPKGPEDELLCSGLPEMEDSQNENESSFGTTPEQAPSNYYDMLVRKTSSAYIRDVKVTMLPVKTKEDIDKFFPKKEVTVIQYGMVVDELLPKVDYHNFELAEEHIKNSINKDKEKAKKEFLERAKDKFILILNDKIIDGHHFLARAKALGITNSLNVIDLTPARFQEKKASRSSLYTAIKKKYGRRINSRKSTSKKLRS